MSSPKVARISVQIAGETREVIVGAFAQIAAKRRFGLDAIREGDPEPTLYGVWIELDGPRPRDEDPEQFDEWLRSVETFAVVTDEEVDDDDPTDPVPSGSSLDSPPTSE